MNVVRSSSDIDVAITPVPGPASRIISIAVVTAFWPRAVAICASVLPLQEGSGR